MKLQLKRSNVIESGAAKEPTASQLEYGELAVNYNKDDPAIFLKDSNNNIIRISGIGNIADDGQVELPASNTPPANPLPGNLWFNSEDGRLYIYYKDPDTEQWVDASPDSWDPSSYPDVNDDTPQSGTLDDRYLMLDASNDPITGDITVSGTVNGRDVAADGAKLDGIEAGADVSQWVDVTGGINYPSGNVAVGTTNPAHKLDIAGDARLKRSSSNDAALYFGETGSNNNFIYGNSDADILTFGTSGSESVRIDSNGNVGIGTTAPSAILQVEQNQAAYSYFDFRNMTSGGGVVWRQIVRNAANTGDTSVDFAKLIAGGFTINNLDTDSDNFTAFKVGSSERLRITSDGYVGIGTTSPGRKLHVKGSNNVMRLESDSTIASRIEFENTGSSSFDSVSLGSLNDDMQFVTSGAEQMRIDSNGNVGIGATDPAAQLHVVGTDQTTGNLDSSNLGSLISTKTLQPGSGGSLGFGASGRTWAAIKGFVKNGNDKSVGDLVFSVRNNVSDALLTEAMRVEYTGNIGIGTNVPAARMHAKTSNQVVGLFERDLGGSGDPADIFLRTYSDSNKDIIFRNENGIFKLFNKIYSTTEPVLSANNNGSVTFAEGVTFNGDAADTNVLDDYEEGTWTPSVRFGNTELTTSNTTFGTNNDGAPTGTYRKIGNIVQVNCGMKISSTTVADGIVQMYGLPFSSTNSYYKQSLRGMLNGAVITENNEVAGVDLKPFLPGGAYCQFWNILKSKSSTQLSSAELPNTNYYIFIEGSYQTD